MSAKGGESLDRGEDPYRELLTSHHEGRYHRNLMLLLGAVLLGKGTTNNIEDVSAKCQGAL
jgi:hypothetical protein